MTVRYNQTRRLRGFGVGTIVPWVGETSNIPPGWIACTGGTRQVSDYPLLYEIVGNTYGGVSGSTFGLPALLNGRAVSDTYEGHYSYLKTKNAAHFDAVVTTSIASDPFWNQISNDINTQNNLGGSSSADLTVSFSNPSNKPNLVATVKEIEFEPGSYDILYAIHPRRLSDRHQAQQAHNHGLNAGLGDQEPPNSFTIGSGVASNCGNKTSGCRAANTGCHTPITPGTRKVLNNSSNCLVKGGSNANNQGTGMTNSGDGVVGGDMYAALAGYSGANLATSLSNDETSRSWANITGHLHTYAGSELRCNVGIQGSYTFYDINSSAVTINQDAGNNAATININTATPSLTMIYIIKAY